MQINKTQAEVLIHWMLTAAKAVQEDHEYRDSSYAGMEVRNLTNDDTIHELQVQFNSAESEKQSES